MAIRTFFWSRTLTIRPEPVEGEARPMPSDVSVEDFLRSSPPPVRGIALALRALVLEAAPQAEEGVYKGWRIVGYSHNGMFCYIGPLKDGVALGFHQGIFLDDPEGLLRGSGKSMRRVIVQDPEDIRAGYFKGLVQQALDRQGQVIPGH